MNNLPESLFANPVWNALQSSHRHFALRAADACRYPADVAPFAAVAEASLRALRDLTSLLDPGESVWVADIGVGDLFRTLAGRSSEISLELFLEQSLECLQMILPQEVSLPNSASEINSDSTSATATALGTSMKIYPLSSENAAEMVALTDVAFPGFFRARTCEMGSYFGVRDGDQMVAMAGERLKLHGNSEHSTEHSSDHSPERYSELSGICTHPSYRGKGLAARLMWRLVRDHRRDGVVSWLHVGSENRRAVELYERMGFVVVRKIMLLKLTRKG
jgi:ribosomal protein S18 acetylase RimI-like enzyme